MKTKIAIVTDENIKFIDRQQRSEVFNLLAIARGYEPVKFNVPEMLNGTVKNVEYNEFYLPDSVYNELMEQLRAVENYYKEKYGD